MHSQDLLLSESVCTVYNATGWVEPIDGSFIPIGRPLSSRKTHTPEKGIPSTSFCIAEVDPENHFMKGLEMLSGKQ